MLSENTKVLKFVKEHVRSFKETKFTEHVYGTSVTTSCWMRSSLVAKQMGQGGGEGN